MQGSVDFLLCEDDVALENDTGIQQTLKTGGHVFIFSQCGLWHAHLIEILKVPTYSQKTWFIKVLMFYARNALKLTYEHF